MLKLRRNREYLLLFSAVEKSPISALAIAWLNMSKLADSIVDVVLVLVKFASLAEEPLESSTIHEDESPGTDNVNISKCDKKICK